MAETDPPVLSSTDEILAQVRDEIRGLREDVRRSNLVATRATTPVPPEGADTEVDGR